MDVDEKEEIKRDLAQPEVLSHEDILQILQDRGVDVSELRSLDKPALVEEYYKRVCPMPQRAYRKNRRGADMARQQIQINKRKRTHAHTEQSNTFTIQENSTPVQSGLVNSHLPPTERLKPPPSAINTERKVIKLGGGKVGDESASKTVPKLDGDGAVTKTKITFGTKSPSAELNSGISGITIHCKDYSKKTLSPTETNNTKTENSDDEPAKDISSSSPVPPKSATKIRLKKPSNELLNSAPNGGGQNGQKVGQSSTNGEHKKQQKAAASAGSVGDNGISLSKEKMETSDEVPKKKFKRVNVKFP